MSRLSDTAKMEAAKCFHGYVMKTEPNFQEMVSFFPKWTAKEADGMWCAAFVFYCCKKAGYDIPIRPAECVSCNLAGCGAWEEWAMVDKRIKYLNAKEELLYPQIGDIVLFDQVFENKEHDHIGIIIDAEINSITVAEGNINNLSGIIKRPIDKHIRAYIRLPENFSYFSQ